MSYYSEMLVSVFLSESKSGKRNDTVATALLLGLSIDDHDLDCRAKLSSLEWKMDRGTWKLDEDFIKCLLDHGTFYANRAVLFTPVWRYLSPNLYRFAFRRAVRFAKKHPEDLADLCDSLAGYLGLHPDEASKYRRYIQSFLRSTNAKTRRLAVLAASLLRYPDVKDLRIIFKGVTSADLVMRTNSINAIYWLIGPKYQLPRNLTKELERLRADAVLKRIARYDKWSSGNAKMTLDSIRQVMWWWNHGVKQTKKRGKEGVWRPINP